MLKPTLCLWLCGGVVLVAGLVVGIEVRREHACQVVLEQERQKLEAERKFFRHGPIVSGEKPYSLVPGKP